MAFDVGTVENIVELVLDMGYDEYGIGFCAISILSHNCRDYKDFLFTVKLLTIRDIDRTRVTDRDWSHNKAFIYGRHLQKTYIHKMKLSNFVLDESDMPSALGSM